MVVVAVLPVMAVQATEPWRTTSETGSTIITTEVSGKWRGVGNVYGLPGVGLDENNSLHNSFISLPSFYSVARLFLVKLIFQCIQFFLFSILI